MFSSYFLCCLKIAVWSVAPLPQSCHAADGGMILSGRRKPKGFFDYFFPSKNIHTGIFKFLFLGKEQVSKPIPSFEHKTSILSAIVGGWSSTFRISEILIAQINNFPDVEVCRTVSPIAHIICWIQGISSPVLKSTDINLCTESHGCLYPWEQFLFLFPLSRECWMSKMLSAQSSHKRECQKEWLSNVVIHWLCIFLSGTWEILNSLVYSPFVARKNICLFWTFVIQPL